MKKKWEKKMKKNYEGGHLLVLPTRSLPQLVFDPLLGPWAWRSPLSSGETIWKRNQAIMGSLGVVWERRQAGECARCDEWPKVCASLPSKSNHRQGSNSKKCVYHLRFKNILPLKKYTYGIYFARTRGGHPHWLLLQCFFLWVSE